ncbi:MAG TPA: hypothetical protein VIT24_11155 [Acidimicrobiales bacterium]|jgi:hypothetical protein
MTTSSRVGRGASRAVLAAAFIVALLALGPLATPQVAEDVVGDIAPAAGLVDHRNDLPVVQPDRHLGGTGAARLAIGRGLLVVLALAGILVATGPDRPRRRRDRVRADRPPTWSRPPRRGPPLLLPG